MKTVRANCRGGRRVLGGGAKTDATFALRASFPVRRVPGGRSRDGWSATAINTHNLNFKSRLTVFAVCAFVDWFR